MKLVDYEFKGVPDELIDFKNDITSIINYGKFQFQVLTSAPSWKGNRGEMAFVVSATTASLFAYMATAGTTWSRIATFTI